VSFAVMTLCAGSQQVFIVVVYIVIDSVWKLLDTPSSCRQEMFSLCIIVWTLGCRKGMWQVSLCFIP